MQARAPKHQVGMWAKAMTYHWIPQSKAYQDLSLDTIGQILPGVIEQVNITDDLLISAALCGLGLYWFIGRSYGII